MSAKEYDPSPPAAALASFWKRIGLVPPPGWVTPSARHYHALTICFIWFWRVACLPWSLVFSDCGIARSRSALSRKIAVCWERNRSSWTILPQSSAIWSQSSLNAKFFPV